MRSALVNAGMAMLVLLGCTGSPDPFTETRAAAVRDSAAAFLAEFRRLGVEAKFDSMSQLYSASPAFRFYESGELRYRSAADVRAALAGFPAGTRIVTEYANTEIEALVPGWRRSARDSRRHFTDPRVSSSGLLAP